MRAGDPLWFRASAKGYGQPTNMIPCVFVRMSDSGRRAYVQIVDDMERVVNTVFVSPKYLSRRDSK